MAGVNPTTSNTYSGAITRNMISLSDIEMPDIQRAVVQKYGKSFGLHNWLSLIGSTFNMKNSSFSLFEQNAVEKLITLADVGSGVGIATNSAGANITFKLAAGDYNAMGKAYLRLRDTILIPKAYMAADSDRDYVYWISNISAATGAAKVYTATPFYADGTSVKAAQIGTAVPIGTKLMVGHDAWGRGEDQPDGTTMDWIKKTFYTSISKETFKIEGGNEDQKWIEIPSENGGVNNWVHIAQFQAEFLLDKKVNDKLWMGQPNDNAANGVITSTFGESNPILATTGLYPTMKDQSMGMSYTGNWNVSYLDDVKPLFLSQGVTAQEVAVFMGDLLYKGFENSAYEFKKEYGFDPIMTKLNSIGLSFLYFEKLGFRFRIQELSNLSNPNNYGAAAYGDYYRKLGFMIPTQENTVHFGDESNPGKIGNLMLGYKNNNGENRTRVVGIVNGPTGRPYPITNTIDSTIGMINSESGLIITKPNQFILIEG